MSSNPQMSSFPNANPQDVIYVGTSEFTKESYVISIDLTKDENLSEAGKISLKIGEYMLPSENSPQEAFARAAVAYSSNAEHAQRLYNYVSNCWFMFASPVLSSAGTIRGCPISCFLNKVGDNRADIGDNWKETLWLSTEGGGVGTDWSGIRSVGTKTSRGTYTPGLMPFLKAVDSITMASIQGGVRRGATAVYLDISHPEIEEFLESRRVTGGDTSRKLLNIHNAVNIPDSFMVAVTNGTPWDLIDPHTKEVKKTVSARDIWSKLLELRVETGEPYIHFIDTSNAALPQGLKDKGLRINTSNLCNEIFLPTAEDRTAVCCLSSVNIEFFDEWSQEERFIPDLIEMLDNVLTVFIEKAPPELRKAVYSATQERSLGLGAMGFHAFLQKKEIPFESPMASGQNRKIFNHIKLWALDTTKRLALERGQAPDMFGYGVRNSHLLALAPNATTGILCNTSPSIEPYNANAFVQKTKNGAFFMKNKQLDHVLRNSPYSLCDSELEEAWTFILDNEGSVQDLPFLSKHHKDVFKTAFELDQRWIIDHAISRQPFLCQGQSLNIFIEPGTDFQAVHKLHKQAWEGKLKGLYYVRSKSVGRIANTTKQQTALNAKRSESTEDTCVSCSG